MDLRAGHPTTRSSSSDWKNGPIPSNRRYPRLPSRSFYYSGNSKDICRTYWRTGGVPSTRQLAERSHFTKYYENMEGENRIPSDAGRGRRGTQENKVRWTQPSGEPTNRGCETYIDDLYGRRSDRSISGFCHSSAQNHKVISMSQNCPHTLQSCPVGQQPYHWIGEKAAFLVTWTAELL